MAKTNWYSIKNAANNTGEVYLYDEIGGGWGNGTTSDQFAKDLAAMGDVKTINVYINSPGGSVFEGLSIYNLLTRHKAKVDVSIDGVAASIASVIAMAGDTINIAENASMMIHNPWSLVIGDAATMRKEADLLDRVGTQLVTTYAARTKATEDKIRAYMDAETWFSATEAKSLGFADSIAPAKRAAASFDLSRFRNAPRHELAPEPPKPLNFAEQIANMNHFLATRREYRR